MYTIYAGGICLFDDTAPDREHMALTPKLTLTAGAAGSLTLTLPKAAEGYDSVRQLKTTIRVERDWDIIWMGRVLTEERDFWNSRVLLCEGALAWLNDYVIPTGTHTGTPEQLLTAILGDASNPAAGTYNGKAAVDRRIAVGQVTVQGSGLTAETDYNPALDAVNRLVSDYGGILRMRYPNGVPTLDWLADYPEPQPGDQGIEFGGNLLEFTRGWDLTDYATAAIVRGAEYTTGEGEQAVKHHYMGSAELPNAITAYGRIERFLDFSDCDSTQRCDTAALEWLQHQYDTMKLEISVLDLRILNPGIKAFDLLQRVPVSSWPHDFAGTFAVTGMEIPLDTPEGTRYTMGSASVAYKRRKYTLTQRTVQAEAEQRAYTDAAADGAVREAGAYTNEVKTTLEAADGQIIARVESTEDGVESITEAVLGPGGISTRVGNAETNISNIDQKADEIKAAVYDNNSGEYTVMTIGGPTGVTIANGTSATNINGGFLNAATVQAGIIRGGIIYVIDGSGNNAGTFYTDGSIGQIGISALMVDFARDGDQVYFASPSSIHFADSGLTLAQLLGI